MFSLLQKIRNKIKISDSTVKLSIAKNVKIVGSTIVIKGENNHLIIDEGVKIHRTTLEIIGQNLMLYIGKNSMIGDNCYLSVKESDRSLLIGASCSLSRNVKIMASDGHPIFIGKERINFAQDIHIQDHVWIADNATILKGVTIESGCVIGINATVAGSISKNSIAVGNPARVVKTGIHWAD